MAKGHRGKPQTAEANNGPAKAKTNNKAADKENSTDTQNLQMSKGRNRRGDKPKLINEEQKPEAVEENSVSLNSNHVSEKKEPGPGVHSKVQPTTEQLMIAKIIDHSASDDPHQRKKIQQVMDVTGKPEDEVATALFDAGWDESRAVELLLEDGDHLSAWEETGKKKKSKKTAVEDNDGWGDDGGNDAGGNGGFQDPRDKRQRGPPRMQRRGRGDSQAKGDRPGRDGDRSYVENGDRAVPSGGRGGRRGDQPPRRGGRGGGTGGRAFSSRTPQSNGGSGPGGSSSGPDPVGFQGSIDTWANPNDQKSSSTENSNNSRGGDRSSREVGGSAPGGEGGGGPGGPRGERPPRGGGRSGRGGGQSGKDAFDNAGNWGDDFPQADDWDNEEYTGSLADTKVFTASGDRGTGQKQRTPPTRPDQQQQQPQQPQQSLPAAAASVANPPQQQPGPVGANSQRGYSAAALAASNGPSVTSTYPQSIDLSTLLQKPTTQSSVGSSAAPGAQFNQQATETLKAVVGIGQTSSNTSAAPGSQVAQQQPNPQQQDNSSALYSYAAQASAFSSIESQGQGRQQPPQSKGQGQAPGGGRTGSRMQPPSSSGAPAVEMPGDSLGRLDVQFGGLDLQFGGSGSANSDAMTGSSGFEFGSASTGNQQVDPNDQKTSSGVSVGSLSGGITKPVTDSFAPTAKEVNKSLSNALSSSGKLNPSAGSTLAAAPIAIPTNQQDSFSKSSSSGTAPTANNSSGHVPNLNSHATNVAPGGGSGSGSGGNNFNKNPGQSDNQGLSGYSTYNNYNKQASGGGYGNSYQQYQQYPNSNSFSSQQQQQQQQQGSAGQSAGSSSQYKGVGQYDKYDPSLSNPAAAVLGLANTNTTNALSGKVSATTASKVNMPNLPPGVASMLHPQYVAAAGLAPAAAFYGLQQPMYGAYGNTGLEDLAAMQRASASAAGLHTLPTTGYYDPNNQFAATSLGAAVANRDPGQNSNIASQLAGLVSSASSVTGGNGNSSAVNTLGSTSGFGSTSGATSTAAVAAASAAAASSALAVNNAADSTSSPGPATSTGSSIGQTGSSSVGQHHSVQQQAQQQQQQQQQQQTAFNLAATNAFAAQQMPPGYAYYFGNMGNMGLQGYPQTPQGHVYQPQAMTVPGAGTTPSQFQKQTYGTSYGSGYDTLGQQQQQQQQQGNAKDFSQSNYSSNGQSKSTGGSAAAGTGKGAHQYWGNTLTSTQLW